MRFYWFVISLQIGIAIICGAGAVGLVSIARDNIIQEAEQMASAKIYLGLDVETLTEIRI